MVIHTIINEYDLLYAQEREVKFALSCGVQSTDPKFGLGLCPSATALPELKCMQQNFKGDNFQHDNLSSYSSRHYTGTN